MKKFLYKNLKIETRFLTNQRAYYVAVVSKTRNGVMGNGVTRVQVARVFCYLSDFAGVAPRLAYMPRRFDLPSGSPLSLSSTDSTVVVVLNSTVKARERTKYREW